MEERRKRKKRVGGVGDGVMYDRADWSWIIREGKRAKTPTRERRRRRTKDDALSFQGSKGVRGVRIGPVRKKEDPNSEKTKRGTICAEKKKKIHCFSQEGGGGNV